MPNPDGSIVFSTEIDNKKAQAELEKLEKKISALESGSEENAVGRTGEFLGRGAG